jgi:hypothetical protein
MVWRTVVRSAQILSLGFAPLLLSALPFCTATSCRLAPLSSQWAKNARFNCFLPTLATSLGPAWTKHLTNFHFIALFAALLAGYFLTEACPPQPHRPP